MNRLFSLFKQDAQFEENRKMWAEITRINDRLGAAEAPRATPESRASSNFNREVDLGILRITADTIFSKEEASKTIVEWLSGAGIESAAYDLRGGDLTGAVTIAFHGTGGRAAQRVDQAIEALRTANGKWRDLFIFAPPDNPDSPPRQLKLYVSKDENPKQRMERQNCKKMLENLKDIYPQYKQNLHKRGNEITFNWLPLCKIEAVAPRTAVTVSWNMERVEAGRFEKDRIMAGFSIESPARSKVQWRL